MEFILLYYVTEIGEFQTVVGGFINIVDQLAKQVEQEKMKVNCNDVYIYLFIKYSRLHI